MPDLIKIEIGKWYFSVVCPKCHRTTVISEAPSPDSPDAHLVYPSPVSIDCDCGTHTDYQPERVLPRQALGTPGTASSASSRPKSNK